MRGLLLAVAVTVSLAGCVSGPLSTTHPTGGCWSDGIYAVSSIQPANLSRNDVPTLFAHSNARVGGRDPDKDPALTTSFLDFWTIEWPQARRNLTGRAQVWGTLPNGTVSSVGIQLQWASKLPGMERPGDSAFERDRLALRPYVDELRDQVHLENWTYDPIDLCA